MDKKRIRGLPGRTSEQPIAKSTTIKDRGGRSDGRAMKAADLTSGGLRCVPQSGLRSPQGGLTAVQKSAEGVVGGASFAEGLNDGRTLGGAELGPAMRPNTPLTGVCTDT